MKCTHQLSVTIYFLWVFYNHNLEGGSNMEMSRLFSFYNGMPLCIYLSRERIPPPNYKNTLSFHSTDYQMVILISYSSIIQPAGWYSSIMLNDTQMAAWYSSDHTRVWSEYHHLRKPQRLIFKCGVSIGKFVFFNFSNFSKKIFFSNFSSFFLIFQMNSALANSNPTMMTIEILCWNSKICIPKMSLCVFSTI